MRRNPAIARPVRHRTRDPHHPSQRSKIRFRGGWGARQGRVCLINCSQWRIQRSLPPRSCCCSGRSGIDLTPRLHFARVHRRVRFYLPTWEAPSLFICLVLWRKASQEIQRTIILRVGEGVGAFSAWEWYIQWDTLFVYDAGCMPLNIFTYRLVHQADHIRNHRISYYLRETHVSVKPNEYMLQMKIQF